MSKIIRFLQKRSIKKKEKEIKVLPLSKILEEVLFGKGKRNKKKTVETDHEEQDR